MSMFPAVKLIFLLTVIQAEPVHPSHYNTMNFSLPDFWPENFDSVIDVYHPRTLFIATMAGSPISDWKFAHKKVPVYTVNLSSKGIVIADDRDKIFIVRVESAGDFPGVFRRLRTLRYWKARDKLLVLVPQQQQQPEATMAEELKINFKLCFDFRAINVAFVFHSSSSIAGSYTYSPFEGDFLRNVHFPYLFPDKLSDFYGFKLRVSLYDNVMNAIPGKGGFRGRDGLMASTIMQHLNATYVYLKPNADGIIRTLNKAQLEEVANGTVDVAFSTRLVKLLFGESVEGTYPHDRDDLTCLVPRRGLKPVDGFFGTFPPAFWAHISPPPLFFLLFLTLSARLYNNKGCEFSRLVIVTLLVLLGQHAPELNLRKFRTVLALYLFFSLIVSSLLLCRLTTHFAASQYYAEIDTLQALAETRYDLFTLPRYRDMLNSTLDADLSAKFSGRVKIVQAPSQDLSFLFGSILEEAMQLDEVAKCRKSVFVLKNHLAIYASIQRANYPEGVQFYRLMPERIMPAITCYIVGYGSPFLARFDQLIERIIQSGLQDHWRASTWHKLSLDEAVMMMGADHLQAKLRSMRPLSLSTLGGAFHVLLFGLSCALLTFLIEIVAKTYF